MQDPHFTFVKQGSQIQIPDPWSPIANPWSPGNCNLAAVIPICYVHEGHFPHIYLMNNLQWVRSKNSMHNLSRYFCIQDTMIMEILNSLSYNLYAFSCSKTFLTIIQQLHMKRKMYLSINCGSSVHWRICINRNRSSSRHRGMWMHQWRDNICL